MKMVSRKSAREETKVALLSLRPPGLLGMAISKPRGLSAMPSLTAQDPWRHSTKSGSAAMKGRSLISSEAVDGAGRQMADSCERPLKMSPTIIALA